MNEEFIKWIFAMLKDNDEVPAESEWEIAYVDGYHDAMLAVLDHLKVKHNEEYRW